MLWASMAFAAGICWAHLAAAHFWTPPSWQVIAALLFLVISLCIPRWHSLASAAALLSIAVLGMAQANLGSPHPSVVLPPQLENQEVEIDGVVIRASLPILEGSLKNSDLARLAAESYQQIDVRTARITCPLLTQDGNCGTTPGELGVRLGIYEPLSEEEAQAASPFAFEHEFRYGQQLRIRGRIRTPQTYGDPGAFDYRAYLLERGIGAVVSVRPGDVQVLPGRGGSYLGRLRDRVRRSLLQHVLSLQTNYHQRWSMFQISRTDTALLAAMLLGERSLLDEDVKTNFQRTGSYHLLVVSGVAVAILAVAVFWLARLLQLPDLIATLLSVVFVGLYVSVTDLGAPVQRAALMCAVYFLVRLLYRKRDPLNAIGAAALIVLVVDTRSLFDSGFQMTFLAVVAIAGIAVPVLERTTAVYRAALYQLDSTGFDLHLSPKQAQFRISLRMVLSRLDLLLPRWLARLSLLGTSRVGLRAAEVAFISALMQAALAAPMAVYFHRATTLALPANVAVVPIMSLLLPMAIVATLLSYLGAWLAFLPKCATALLLHLATASVFTFAHFRAADLRVPDPAAWTLLMATLAIAVCILAASRRPAFIVSALLILAFSDWAIVRLRHPDIVPGKLEVTAIDVGQGDSLLVVLPEGQTMLIDGGGTLGARASGFDVGEDVVSPYLWSRGFSHIDTVALSHAHGDHIGGLPAVLRNFHPAELWLAPGPSTATLDALIKQANDAGIPLRNRKAGEHFEFGGATFDILAPSSDRDERSRRDNDDSMVMHVAYRDTSVLLEGDAEKRTERAIAPDLSHVTLLKVAHHGSSTSSIPELLEQIQPQFAVISVGKFNRYGHPTPQVLKRISQEGACIFRTDLDGAISFYLDGTSLTAARWGRQRAIIDFLPRWIPPQQAGHCAAVQ
jgi:competence protein ComEC